MKRGRLLCWALGCRTYFEPELVCDRCGGRLYEGECFEVDWIDLWIVMPCYRLLRLIPVPRRCANCQRWFISTKRSGYCCSKRCWGQWVPF